MVKFRDLEAQEIEVRVAMVKENGAQLLLYKDARCDMRILDETVGPENWQKRFHECKGTLFCSVGVNVNGRINAQKPDVRADGSSLSFYAPSWVWKSDAGEPSNMSAQKGEASDAFKRACTNWGIGRELYTSPFIWVPADKCKIQPRGNKFACFDRFSVAKVQIENGEITGIRIQNDTNGKVAFSWLKR